MEPNAAPCWAERADSAVKCVTELWGRDVQLWA